MTGVDRRPGIESCLQEVEGLERGFLAGLGRERRLIDHVCRRATIRFRLSLKSFHLALELIDLVGPIVSSVVQLVYVLARFRPRKDGTGAGHNRDDEPDSEQLRLHVSPLWV